MYLAGPSPNFVPVLARTHQMYIHTVAVVVVFVVVVRRVNKQTLPFSSGLSISILFGLFAACYFCVCVCVLCVIRFPFKNCYFCISLPYPPPLFLYSLPPILAHLRSCFPLSSARFHKPAPTPKSTNVLN